ncbi:MAG: hypothetical protein ABJB12_15915 [Pseudomonadota bacterium]
MRNHLSSVATLIGLVALLPHCSSDDTAPAGIGGEAGDTGAADSAGHGGASGSTGHAGAGTATAGAAATSATGEGGSADAGASGTGETGVTADAGAAGTAAGGRGGGAGAAGSGGVGATAGSAGTGGTSGSAGTAGTSGTSGTAGTAGTAGVGGAGSIAATVGTYVAGDFHNHTTCSDGSISMAKLIKKSTDKTDTPWGLDWFVQAGHGGNGNRNCTLVEDATLATPAYPYTATVSPNTTWEASGVTPKGDTSGTSPNRNMWRWESITEFQYPLIEYFNAYKNLPLFLGIETVGPGHEHISMSVITGQVPKTIDTLTLPTTPGYTATGNANALAQWEYCFDRNDTDTSRGMTNAYDCTVPGSLNAADPSWNATGHKLVPAAGAGHGTKGHAKTLEGLKWMATYHPNASYYVPSHLERAGQFNPDGDNGYNVESLRDFNNTAPKIAFGMETQPGHGASTNRGEYQVLRNNINGTLTDSVGGTTYGGTGVYGAQIGGVWDALLGEGRNFWFFASSDWHNRGSFGPDDRRTTQDFYPGEYQRNFTMVKAGADKLRPQTIVDGLRSGNNFATGGQIIDRLSFVACVGQTDAAVADAAANAAINKTTIIATGCATMGEKLVLDQAGQDVVVGVAVRDPAGANYSPYTFSNPSLKQINVTLPINTPVLDHIDLIGGKVSGYRIPGSAGYSGAWPTNTNWLKADGTTADLSVVPDAAKNTTAAILKTFSGSGASPWQTVTASDGSVFLTMTFRIPAVTASQYVRLRGTNMPPAVPYETDANGNPLSDVYTNANDTARLTIPCTTVHSTDSQFDGCPDHLAVATGASPITGQKAVSFDVAAWSDLWFYSNPIYIQVYGSKLVAGVN